MNPRARYEQWATQAAHQYGIPVGIFKSLITHESGWRSRVRSPAGAIGLGQLMPATARELGVNPYNAHDNIFASARYFAAKVKTFGSVKLALAAYNAGDGAVHKYGGIPPYKETQDYVAKILRDAPKYGATGHAAAPAAMPGAPGAPGTPGYDITTPTPPDFKSAAMANLQDAALHGGHFDPLSGLANVMAAITEAGTTTTHIPGTPATPGVKGAAAPKGGWQKWVRMAQGADRPGVSTEAAVKAFVGRLGRALGKPLTIGTGTQHNEYVVGTHRQSAHWVGRAADVPMTGAALTRAGRRALILAGMSPAEARRAKGGIYNVGRYQIIFDTYEGGNHYTHLHVGLRG